MGQWYRSMRRPSNNGTNATTDNHWDARRVTKPVKWRTIPSPNPDLITSNGRSMLENLVLSWINIWKISSQVGDCWLVFRRDLVKAGDVMGTSLREKNSTFI